MVFIWIGIAIVAVILVILIVKAVKTPSRDFIGVELQCKNCGTKTNGLKCPKCEDKSQTFGI